MDSEFITLPDDVETLQKQLVDKEKRIQELILENLSLKNLIPCDSMEELEVELDENAETIELKHFEGETGDDDDEESFPNLGENSNQEDFMNIFKMLLTQGLQRAGSQSDVEGFPDLSAFLQPKDENEEPEEHPEPEGPHQPSE
jgi:hypothetical protein